MVELHVKCCRLQYFSHQTPPITFADFTHTSSDEILIHTNQLQFVAQHVFFIRYMQ